MKQDEDEDSDHSSNDSDSTSSAPSTAQGGEPPASVLLAVSVAGLAALPVVAWSEWVLKSTGKPLHNIPACGIRN